MKFVPVKVSRIIGMQKLKIQANSPTILLVAGVAGTIGTTVLASRATLKAAPIFDATHLELERLAYNAEKSQDETGIRPDENDMRKQRVAIYTETAVQLTRLYAPAFVLGTISVAALVGSHKILSDRYANLGAAYVSLQEAMAAYRSRVVKEVGEEREREIYHDVTTVDTIEMGPNGPKKVKTEVPGPDGGSPYAKLFGPDNPNWRTTPEYNTMFLRQVNEYCNRKLRMDGHLFLNRVYEELGMEDTEAGAVVGWLYERGVGDSFVDFGIWSDDRRQQMYDFMAGNEGEIMLDFNVAGPIHKLLNLPKKR